MTEWWRTNTDTSDVLTEEKMRAAFESVRVMPQYPNIVVLSPKAWRAYDWFLRVFNVWSEYAPRLFLPMWMPRVAWGRPWRWAMRKWRRWKLHRDMRREGLM